MSVQGDLPEKREGHTACVIDDKLFIFGGVKKNERYLSDLSVLNLALMQWSKPMQVSHLPGARWGHAGVAVSNSLFLFGGFANNQFLSDSWEMSRWGFDKH